MFESSDVLTSLTFDAHNFLAVAGGIIGSTAIVHILFYFFDKQGIRRYPGPLLARLSYTWLGWIAVRGKVITAVHDAHKKYGKCSY